MVAVRIERTGLEVIAKAPASARVHRQEIQAAFDDDGSSPVRVTRTGAEVIAKAPPFARVHRQEIQAAFDDDGSSAVRVERTGLEVIYKAPVEVHVHRQEIQAAFNDEGSAAVRMTRTAVEVIARSGVPAPLPPTHPALLTWFLHNWVDGLRMETSYTTDITRSPITGAEERLALVERPSRIVTALWSRFERAEVDRLLRTLRRATEDELAIPLVQDTLTVGASSGTPNRTLTCSPAHRRFFTGGRVVVFPAHGTYFEAGDVHVYDVAGVSPAGLTMTAALTQAYAAGEWRVAPVIYIEKILEASVRNATDDKAEVSVDFLEIQDQGALPPTFSGNVPNGWQHHDGLPIFEPNPDWADGLSTTFRRRGAAGPQGRKIVVSPDGPGYVQVQDFSLFLEREDFWKHMQFFDSRRGRMGAFWAIDQERFYTVSDTDDTFIDVVPSGIFSEFDEGFSEHVGIVMRDGTIYIREIVTIQDVVSTWRITITGDDLPAIDVSQIERLTRARKSRFDADSFVEEWRTTELCTSETTVIELQNEKEIDV